MQRDPARSALTIRTGGGEESRPISGRSQDLIHIPKHAPFSNGERGGPIVSLGTRQLCADVRSSARVFQR